MRIEGGATLGQYTYDPFGRRLSKTVNGVTTWFHYDDTGLLAEYSASGQLLNEYQYRPGSTWMTNPLFKRDGATGKVHYYYNSHLGQPLKLFDKAGKITWAARSQAFGQTTVFVNETENNLRFPGQYEDGETGLFLNLQRYYDHTTGRYLQRDPYGKHMGANDYAYVRNPLSFADPLGLWCISPELRGTISGFVGGFVGGLAQGLLTGNPFAALGMALVQGTIGAVAGGVFHEAKPVGAIYGAAAGTGITGGSDSSIVGAGVGALVTYAGAKDGLPAGVAGAIGGGVGGAIEGFIGPSAGDTLRSGLRNAGKLGLTGALGGLAGGLAEQIIDAGQDCGCGQ